jgi:hypothetical protein
MNVKEVSDEESAECELEPAEEIKKYETIFSKSVRRNSSGSD